MGETMPDDHKRIETRIVGLYNILYDETLQRSDIEFYEIETDDFEGEVYLPEIGLNVDLWQEWTTEKRIEVLIHEFAHTENYDDDHHPDFWDRVVTLTESTITHRAAVEDVFAGTVDPETLKTTIVESIHEHVIEPDIDSVETRKHEVSEALGLSDE